MVRDAFKAPLVQTEVLASALKHAPVFEARGLCKTYTMGEVEVRALRDVDLVLEEGELVVLLGPSGSGKSTLLNILGGLDVPTAGSVIYQDHDLTAAGEAALTDYRRTHVGFVFQFYNLIPSLTARENVALVTDIAGIATPAYTEGTRLPTSDQEAAELGHVRAQLVEVVRVDVADAHLLGEQRGDRAAQNSSSIERHRDPGVAHLDGVELRQEAPQGTIDKAHGEQRERERGEDRQRRSRRQAVALEEPHAHRHPGGVRRDGHVQVAHRQLHRVHRSESVCVSARSEIGRAHV